MKILKYIWHRILVDIYVTRSYFLIKKKKFDKAEEILNKAEKLNVRKYLVYNNLSVIALIHKKDLDEGARCLEIALTDKPKFKVALINLSYIYIKLEQYEKALEVIEKAEKCWYLKALAYNNHAVVLIRQKNLDQALEYAKKSYKKNKWLYVALYNIGIANFKLRHLVDAVKSIEKAYKKSKEAKFLYSLALAYAYIGEYKKAVKSINSMPEKYIFDEDMTDWNVIFSQQIENSDLEELKEIVLSSPKKTWKEL